MPDGNLAIVKQAFDAFNRRDVDALVSLTAPNVRWYPVLPARDGIQVYRGHAGVRDFMAGIAQDYMQAVAIPEELRSFQDRVLVFCRVVDVAVAADVDIKLATAAVYHLHQRLITRIHGFIDPAEAMLAAQSG